MGIGLTGVAARSAYYAAFHAAAGVIFELSGRVAKTHAGVRTMFFDLARTDPRLTSAMTRFLADSYVFKDIADYQVGSKRVITSEEAAEAMTSAEDFVRRIEAVIG